MSSIASTPSLLADIEPTSSAPTTRKPTRDPYRLPDLGAGLPWFELTWKLWREHHRDPGSRKIVMERWVQVQHSLKVPSRLVALAAWAYVQEEEKIRRGYMQTLETFLGPRKATVMEWLERAQELESHITPNQPATWPNITAIFKANSKENQYDF